VIRIIPLILASLLLGAHFLRTGNLVLAAICVLLPLLLFIKRRWSWLIVQMFTYVGVAIWGYAAFNIVQQRIYWGMPWIRVVLILGAVVAFTAWAGLLLNASKVKERYFIEG